MGQRIYTMDPESDLWDRQPFDSEKSYDMFLMYYFPQEPPRSVNEAYRRANPGRGGDVAPGNWRRWADGKDTKGRRKQVRIYAEDGTEFVIDAPTWHDRATAHDREQERRAREKFEKEKEEIRQAAIQAATSGIKKVEQWWHNYTPGPNESPLSMARTLRLFNDEMERMLGLWGAAAQGDEQDWRELLPEDVSPDEIEKFIEDQATMIADRMIGQKEREGDDE